MAGLAEGITLVGAVGPLAGLHHHPRRAESAGQRGGAVQLRGDGLESAAVAEGRARDGRQCGGGEPAALEQRGHRLRAGALQPGPELGKPQLDGLEARRRGGGQLVVERPVGRAGAGEREPHAERSRSRNCSAQRVLQKYTERPPASFRMARERTT